MEKANHNVYEKGLPTTCDEQNSGTMIFHQEYCCLTSKINKANAGLVKLSIEHKCWVHWTSLHRILLLTTCTGDTMNYGNSDKNRSKPKPTKLQIKETKKTLKK